MELENLIENELIHEAGIFFLKNSHESIIVSASCNESTLRGILKKSSDLSSTSRELEQSITDEKSRHSLSRNRSLILRSLKIRPAAKVLEIGSGCGAITRFLGEVAETVVAIERNPERAFDCGARTAGMRNVHILCADYRDIALREKFDIVVVNIAFEGHGAVVGDFEAAQNKAKVFRSFLTADGSIVCFFDGRVVSGIQATIASLFYTVIDCVEILIPLPNWLYPTAVVRSKLLNRVNCAELFANLMSEKRHRTEVGNKHARLMWHDLQNSGALGEYAGSCVAVIGGYRDLVADDWFGDIYSIQRNARYSVRTSIQSDKSNNIRTTKRMFDADRQPVIAASFEHRLESTAWANGYSVHTQIVREICSSRPEPTEKRIEKTVRSWWRAISKEIVGDGKLAGKTLDYHWQNAIFDDADIVFIDREWRWNSPINPTWIIYRTVQKFVDDEIDSVAAWNRMNPILSSYSIILAVARIVGIHVRSRDLFSAVKNECEFQQAVTGQRSRPTKVFLRLFEPIALRRYRVRRFEK